MYNFNQYLFVQIVTLDTYVFFATSHCDHSNIW